MRTLPRERDPNVATGPLRDKDAVRRIYRHASRVYDHLYPLFAGPAGARDRYYASLDLDPSDRVLDLGCGTGRSTARLLERTPRVDGIDVTPAQLRVATRKPALAAARFVVGDAGNLPYADGSFDAVVSIGVLQHLPDPGTALREAHRVVADGGRLRVVVPKRPEGRLRAAIADAAVYTATPAGIERLCRDAGWRSVETRRVRAGRLVGEALVVSARA